MTRSLHWFVVTIVLAVAAVAAAAVGAGCGNSSVAHPDPDRDCRAAAAAAIAQRAAETPPVQVLQTSHRTKITIAKFSPLGYLATASEDGEVRIWDTRALLQLATIHSLGANDLAWTAGGDQLTVLGSYEGHGMARNRRAGAARVYDLGGRVVGEWPFAVDGIARLDGDRWVSRVARDAVVLDTKACTQSTHEVGCYGSMCNGDVATSPDGDWFITPDTTYTGGPKMFTFRLFHPTEAKPYLSIEADHLEPLDRAHLLEREGTHLRIRDAATGAVVRELPFEVGGFETAVADGNVVFTWLKADIAAFDIETGKPLWKQTLSSEISAFTADHGRVAIATADLRLVLYDERTGRAQAELGAARARMPVAPPRVIGDKLYVRSADEVSVWSLVTGHRLFATPAPDNFEIVDTGSGGVKVAIRAPDETGVWPRQLVLRDLVEPNSGEDGGAQVFVDTPLPIHHDVARTVAVHPRAPRAVVEVGDDQLALAVGGDTGEIVAARGWTTTFSSTGTYVAGDDRSGSGVTITTISDGSDVQMVPALHAPPAAGNATAGASTSARPPLICPQLANDDLDDTRMTFTRGLSRYAFASDDHWFIAEFDGGFRAYELGVPHAEDQARVVEGRIDARVSAIAVAAEPGAPTVVAGTSDGELVVWHDGQSRRGASTGGEISAVMIDDARHRAVTVSIDGAVRIWDLATLQVLVAFGDYEDDEWIAFTPRGAYTGTTEVADRVTWRFDADRHGPIEAFRFEQFDRQLRRDDVIAQRLRGGADIDVAALRPPHVELVGAPAIAADYGHATLHVHASSAGSVQSIIGSREGRIAANVGVCRASADASVDVPLLPGTNRVQLTAFDERGAASNPAAVEIAAPARASGRPELWVVAVGVSEYPQLDHSLWLEYAADDARGVAQAFARAAGPAQPFAAAHVQVLADREVTPAAVKAAVGTLSQMKPDDLAIVFFAGHGVAIADGSMVFLTADSKLDAASTRSGAIAWADLAGTLAALPGRALVLLDACHSGHFNADVIVPNAALAGTLQHAGRGGIFVFAAAKGRQMSYEPHGARGFAIGGGSASDAQPAAPHVHDGGHGLFSQAVIDVLAHTGADHDGDGVVELSELVDEVSRRVSAQTQGLQTPWVVRRESFGDYGIIRAGDKSQ